MPATHADELKKEYKRIARGYAQSHKKIEDLADTFKIAQYFRTLLPEGASVLDLGCGNGCDSEWFAKQGMKMTLLDLSEDLLDLAKEKVPDATFVQMDMTDMDFPEASFDGIWANASLLHLTREELEKVLEKIHSFVKDNGVIAISLKKGEGETYLDEEKYETVTRRFFTLVDVGALRNMVTKAGFSVIRSEEKKSGTTSWIWIFAQK